jgi:hypothetical protein
MGDVDYLFTEKMEARIEFGWYWRGGRRAR